jgi:hypothetical protein
MNLDSEDENDIDEDDEGPVGWKTSSNFSTRIQEDDEAEAVPYQDNFTDEDEPDEEEQEEEPQYDDGYTSASSAEQETQLKTNKRGRVVKKTETFVVVLQEENDFK